MPWPVGQFFDSHLLRRTAIAIINEHWSAAAYWRENPDHTIWGRSELQTFAQITLHREVGIGGCRGKLRWRDPLHLSLSFGE